MIQVAIIGTGGIANAHVQAYLQSYGSVCDSFHHPNSSAAYYLSIWPVRLDHT